MTKEVLNGTTYNYSYDAAGNIKTKTKLTGSGTDTYTYGNSEWRDLLTAYNGHSITYDTVGNPTSWYDGATMTWVNGKRLASISAVSGVHAAISYTYDADGLRLTKTVGDVEHRYIWQGDKLVSEHFGNNTLEFYYDESGRPLAISINGAVYFYVTNLQGDVTAIVSSGGEVKGVYNYDAFGKLISKTDNSIMNVNPLRYRGYYYDSDTNLYYVKSRYYDPQICRFINADGLASTGQGFIGCNMFAYCLNNPVNMADYSGSWPEWVSKVGGIILATAAVTLCVVACVALAPAAVCATTTSLMAYGLSATAAETVAEIGVAIVAADAAVYAVDTGYSAVTGESPVLEAMGYDYETYEFWQFASSAGMYGFGYMAGAGAQLGVCFIQGTLVSTDEGQIPIEEIKTGDLVWAWNEETGEVALKPVIETYINECDELIHLFLNGETITCTPNHPFYVPQKGWTEAAHLRAGDILVLLNGEYVVLEKVQHELLEAPVTVYNFQVEDYHTYYVGESGVRVHNASCGNNVSGKIFASNPKNSREVLSFLKSKGFEIVSQEGSHIKLTNGSNIVIVPNHGGKDLPLGTLRSIIKQAGLWRENG